MSYVSLHNLTLLSMKRL